MSSVIRIGTVSKVNYEDGTIEVAYEDRDGSVTDEICVVSNALYRMPVVGAMVCVLHNSDSQEMGTCIGTFWNEDNKPVGGKKQRYRYDYNDKKGKAFPFGVKRNEATYATVTIRFNLSAEQKTVVMIPQGTRVRTAAGIYFATAAYAQIAIGETYVDVLAQAEVVGASGNDVPIGVVDTLVDAIPYVAAVENVDTSSGGADAESDDSLTRRIWLSPTTYSCAGPRDAYEYWAVSFRSDVENAIAVSPRSQPCTVYIFFMLTGGRMPSEKDMSEMQAYLMNEARRPMTDQVICKAPEEVEYGIDFTYYIGAGNAKGASIVQENVTKAVEEFQQWQRSIGRDISPMELIYRLRVAGVKRVELRQPVYMVVEGGSDLEKAKVQIPKLSGTPTIIYGGVEDD